MKDVEVEENDDRRDIRIYMKEKKGRERERNGRFDLLNDRLTD